MKTKSVVSMVLAVGGLFGAGCASAGAVSDLIDDTCDGINSTGEAQCAPEARTAARGTNIFPGEDLLWHVYDETKVLNVKVHNGATGQFDNYRLILVKDVGIAGSSLTHAAALREGFGSTRTVDEPVDETLDAMPIGEIVGQ